MLARDLDAGDGEIDSISGKAGVGEEHGQPAKRARSKKGCQALSAHLEQEHKQQQKQQQQQEEEAGLHDFGVGVRLFGRVPAGTRCVARTASAAAPASTQRRPRRVRDFVPRLRRGYDAAGDVVALAGLAVDGDKLLRTAAAMSGSAWHAAAAAAAARDATNMRGPGSSTMLLHSWRQLRQCSASGIVLEPPLHVPQHERMLKLLGRHHSFAAAASAPASGGSSVMCG